jgi:hypothetical protein
MDITLPKESHSAIICGATDCGKTKFALDLLDPGQGPGRSRGQYADVFDRIVIICPTIQRNRTYLDREWLWTSPRVVIVPAPGERLHDWLRCLYEIFAGQPTLYLIDDLAASRTLTRKKDMLSELAFSGRHAQQSVWVLAQRYNAVLKDLREQTKWVALFYCKDRDSFDECLRENDIVPASERPVLRAELASRPRSKLLLKTSQPSAYMVA